MWASHLGGGSSSSICATLADASEAKGNQTHWALPELQVCHTAIGNKTCYSLRRRIWDITMWAVATLFRNRELLVPLDSCYQEFGKDEEMSVGIAGWVKRPQNWERGHEEESWRSWWSPVLSQPPHTVTCVLMLTFPYVDKGVGFTAGQHVRTRRTKAPLS